MLQSSNLNLKFVRLYITQDIYVVYDCIHLVIFVIAIYQVNDSIKAKSIVSKQFRNYSY